MNVELIEFEMNTRIKENEIFVVLYDKTFVSEVIYNGKVLATGQGKSKKQAEMDAAKFAIEAIKK